MALRAVNRPKKQLQDLDSDPAPNGGRELQFHDDAILNGSPDASACRYDSFEDSSADGTVHVCKARPALPRGRLNNFRSL